MFKLLRKIVFLCFLFLMVAIAVCLFMLYKNPPVTLKAVKKVTFSPDKAYIDGRVLRDADEIHDTDGVRSFTKAILNVTSKYLRYGFVKQDLKRFEFKGDIKTTDCINYAFLFKKLFDRTAQKHHLKNYHADIVHGNVYVLGRYLGGHYWVLVRDERNKIKYYVDPVAYDYLRIPSIDFLIL